MYQTLFRGASKQWTMTELRAGARPVAGACRRQCAGTCHSSLITIHRYHKRYICVPYAVSRGYLAIDIYWSTCRPGANAPALDPCPIILMQMQMYRNRTGEETMISPPLSRLGLGQSSFPSFRHDFRSVIFPRHPVESHLFCPKYLFWTPTWATWSEMEQQCVAVTPTTRKRLEPASEPPPTNTGSGFAPQKGRGQIGDTQQRQREIRSWGCRVARCRRFPPIEKQRPMPRLSHHASGAPSRRRRE